MPRNEEGEFELVLGNRQLLSVFFVIVILMGVCFAAGYIFGRNSSTAVAGSGGTTKGQERAIVIDPTTSAEGKGTAQRSPLAPGQAVVKGGGAPVTPQPQAAAKPPAERPSPAAPPREAPQPAAETPKTSPPPPPTKPAVQAATGVVQPEAGQTFLQVAAVKRPDADTLVAELRKKEFSAAVGPGPNESLFRVLVGPIRDSAEIAKQRARLKELGFDPIVKRY